MEYSVPRECLFEAFEAVQRVIEELSFPVTFPVEVRSLSADDIPLSMASERETGFIAVHLYNRVDPKDFSKELNILWINLMDGPIGGNYIVLSLHNWRSCT